MVNGFSGTGQDGGAIVTHADLSLTDVTILSSTAGGSGGALFSEGANVSIAQSTFAGNSASGHGGGAVLRSVPSGNTPPPTVDVSITSSTISHNTSVLDGAGIYAVTALLDIQHSTLANNSTDKKGGGLFVADEQHFPDGEVTLLNSTVVGNTADSGGGIWVQSARRLDVANTTVAGNDGGGVFTRSSPTYFNSIFIGNVDQYNQAEDVGGTLPSATNAAHNVAGSGLSRTNGTIIVSDWKTVLENDGSKPILKDNGGSTQTVALLPGSPAIDAGDSTMLPLDIDDLNDDGNTTEVIPFDQTGNVRVLDMPGITVGTADGLDIGAFEQQLPFRFFDENGLALQTNNPDGFVEPGVPVYHNGNLIGNQNYQVVEAFGQVEGTNDFPLTFVDLVANTFARPTYQNEDGSSGALGTTVVGTPSFRTNDSTFHFVPEVTRADIITGEDDLYKSIVTANFGAMASVTSTKTLASPEVGATAFDIGVHFEASEDINLTQGSFTGNDRFRVLMLSSMFESATQFDANGIRYEDANGIVQTFFLNDSTTVDQHLFAQPIEIGSYLELFKTKGSTWFPDSPTIRIDINNNDGLQLGLQGFLSDSDDPNDDSLGIWLEWLDAPNTVTSGTEFDLSFTATASAPGTPGIAISETDDTTIVSEAGTTDTFTVALNAQPLADVTVAVVSENTNEGIVSPTGITFTPANWDAPQTVTVTGQDDSIDDGDVTYNVSLTTSSGQASYDGLSAGVSATTVDNDAAGFTVSKNTVSLPEDGTTTDAFTVVLDSEPVSDVVFALSISSAPAISLNPMALTFTAADWNTAQEISVSALNDDIDNGDRQTEIVVSVNRENSDDVYDGVPDQNITATTTDDDTAGFTLSKTTATVSEDGTTTVDSFSIILNSEPLSDVVIDLPVGNDPDASTDEASLTFTPENWNTSQTINLTGLNDDVDDGDDETVITVAVNGDASDDTFDAVPEQTITVTTLEDDQQQPPTVTIAPNQITTNANPIYFSLTFSEPVTGLELQEIVVNNGVARRLLTDDGINYHVSVVPAGLGEVTVTVPAGATTDIDGDVNSEATATITSTFDANAAPPELMPVVVQPHDMRPAITWTPDAEAEAYEIWIGQVFPENKRVFEAQSIVTTASFTPPQDFDPAFYRIWIRTIKQNDITGPWSVSRDFDIRPQLLGPIGPSFDSRPTFSWSAIPNTSGYELFIRTSNPTVGDIIIDDIPAGHTTYTPDNGLPNGKIRWWVRSTDAIYNRGWSDAGVTNVNGRVSVLSASNSITWQSANDVGRYILHVQNRDTKAVAIRENNLTDSTFTPSTALESGNYRVWVKAIRAVTGSFTSGFWSRAFDFTVAETSDQVPLNTEDGIDVNANFQWTVMESDNVDTAKEQNPQQPQQKKNNDVAMRPEHHQNEKLHNTPAAVLIFDEDVSIIDHALTEFGLLLAELES